jgi:hypothetical protein
MKRVLDAAYGDRVKVFHEACRKQDAQASTLAYEGELDTTPYLTKRLDCMEGALKRAGVKDKSLYAEVNSYLRYIPNSLERYFNVPVFGLIRDGRYVVRSMLRRGIYRVEDRIPILPKPNTKASNAWSNMTATEKCSWYWAETYRILMEDGIEIYKLEDLNKSKYELLELLDRVGISYGRAHATRTFKNWKDKRVNKSFKVTTPPPWGPSRQKAFSVWAGDVQSEFGYPIEWEVE